ncbi:hypothetical protein GPECTOR_9g492 [Gonium pectorale]|uniref:Uncharacterized protein n=1 Tax=Gonium pectorale TaxID=33097 RepID=A0A150GRT0_GONPE|nr:hypothetical protein GPECTOR_9g492 [Gonium pectorale]|eukprot:KXZ52448.1 hypothetical protein GPECTOR_9g492 [Gonium pectorale]
MPTNKSRGAAAVAAPGTAGSDGGGNSSGLRGRSGADSVSGVSTAVIGGEGACSDGANGADGSGCFFAANLHNSRQLLPNLILQLLALLGSLGGGRDAARCFVSIYESGSKDSTPALLSVLRRLLDLLGVPNRIVTGGSISRQQHRQQDAEAQTHRKARARRRPDGTELIGGEARIAFLAALRNAALEPLQQQNRTAGSGRRFRRVVFLNDIYFCSYDVLRLLAYDSADMVCGLDFIKSPLWLLAEHERREVMAAHLAAAAPHPLPAGLAGALSRLWLPYKIWKKLYGKRPDLWPWSPRLLFYDIWVARDAGGGRLRNLPPYSLDAWTAPRLAAGLPTPVYCCWNGLAVLRADPLLGKMAATTPQAEAEDVRKLAQHSLAGPAAGRNGSRAAQDPLRFRSHRPTECAASECSMFCDDLHAAGYHRVMIDPNVRLSYDWPVARVLYDLPYDGPGGADAAALQQGAGAEGLGWRPLAAVAADAAKVARSWEGSPGWLRHLADGARRVECCGIQPGKETADFEHGCSRVDMTGAAGWARWRDGPGLPPGAGAGAAPDGRRLGEE